MWPLHCQTNELSLDRSQNIYKWHMRQSTSSKSLHHHCITAHLLWDHRHRVLDCPRSQWTHRSARRQRRWCWQRCVAHSSADPALRCCPHRGWESPRWPRSHLPAAQQRRGAWIGFAAQSPAALGHQHWHRRNRGRPRSPPNHPSAQLRRPGP